MKRLALILCAVGFVFLVVGCVLTVGADPFASQVTIPSFGTIRAGPEESPSESQSVQASEPQLDKVGYAAVLVSFGFFAAAAFLHSRKS